MGETGRKGANTMALKTKAKKVETVESLTFAEHACADDRFEVEHEGFKIIVRFEYDNDADVSYLGEFSDTPEEGAINHHATDKWLGRSFRGQRYFNPPNYDDTIKYYLETEKVSPEEAKAQADRTAMVDYERLVDYYNDGWSMVGMIVTVYLDGVRLGDSSIWGVETDAGADYFKELFSDQLHQAMIEARKHLDKLVEAARKLPKPKKAGAR